MLTFLCGLIAGSLATLVTLSLCLDAKEGDEPKCCCEVQSPCPIHGYENAESLIV